MAALTADRDTPYSYTQRVKPLGVKANAVIYAGALVAVDASGYAIPASDTAALVVVGWAATKADNTGGANNAKTVSVYVGVASFNVAANLASSGRASQNATVEVVDDNTVGLAGDAGTVNNIAAGKLEYVDADGLFWFSIGL